MHALLTLRVILEDQENGLKQLISVMDMGSTGILPIKQNDNPCDLHEDPNILSVREIDPSEKEIEVEIGIPPCSAGLGTGLSMLLGSMCYCSVFSALKRFVVHDIKLPKKCLDEYIGPRYGVAGIRELFGITKGPILGIILKPRLRMSLPEILPTVQKALESGADYVIDDELIVSPKCSPFSERAERIMDLVRTVREKTGRKVGYFMNVTADIETSQKLIEEGLKYGVSGFTLNCITMGFSAVRFIIDRCCGHSPFIINNIGRGVLTRKSTHCLSEQVIAFLSRLSGGDAIYTGPLTQDFPYENLILSQEVSKLQGKIGDIKTCFSVSSGSINLEEIIKNITTLGSDVMLQMGRGLFSDPKRIQSTVPALIHIIRAISEVSNPFDIISDVRRIVGISDLTDQERIQALSNKIILSNQRLSDIIDNLEKEFSLLKKTEDAFRLEDRPKSQQRFEEELIAIRKRITSLLMEYEQLQTKGQLSDVKTIDTVTKVREYVAESFLLTLDDIDETEERNIFIEELGKILKTIYESPKYKQLPSEVANKISDSTHVLESNINVSDKLKITIPIIPLLLKYEGEISLSSKISISGLWEKIVSFIDKRFKKS